MSNSLRCIIGLTGLPSSGKGEVAAALLKLANANGWQAGHLSFSDQIKEEARRRGTSDDQFNRELLTRIGIQMRRDEGTGVLAARIADKIAAWPGPCPEVFVVEALRHVGEIEVLRKRFGKKFLLFAVESEPRIIAQRLIARKRADESPHAMQSEENAIQLLEHELEGKLSALGPNVGSCLKHADVHLSNNGTLEELNNAVARIFKSLPEV